MTGCQLNNCLSAVTALLSHPWAREQLTQDNGVTVELVNVMHRQLLTQDTAAVQSAVMAVVSSAVAAALEQLAAQKKAKLKELFPANQSITRSVLIGQYHKILTFNWSIS